MTLQNMIKQVLQALMVQDPGDDDSSIQRETGLTVAKTFLQGLIDEIGIYAVTESTETLAVGTASYTIGLSGADLTAQRPRRIVGAFVRDSSSLDHVVRIITSTQYWARGSKATQGRPTELYYTPEVDDGKYYVWPTPNAAETLRLFTESAIDASSFTTSTELSTYFPVTYEGMIKWNLCIELAPYFNVQPAPTVMQRAFETKQAVKKQNIVTNMKVIFPEITGTRFGGYYDINAE